MCYGIIDFSVQGYETGAKYVRWKVTVNHAAFLGGKRDARFQIPFDMNAFPRSLWPLVSEADTRSPSIVGHLQSDLL